MDRLCALNALYAHGPDDFANPYLSPTGGFLAGPISDMLLAQYDWRMMMTLEGAPAFIWMALW